jgi:hypothetical protein
MQTEILRVFIWRFMMKVVIFGSRTIEDMREVEKALEHSPVKNSITEIVSGGASGVDTLAQQYAEAQGIPFKLFPEQRELYGRKAGPLRNIEMSKYAEFGVAVWDGKSRGTAHMIGLMEGRVFVWQVSGDADKTGLLNAAEQVEKE